MTRLLFLEMKGTVYGGQKALLARCRELDARGLDYTILHPFRESDFIEQYQDLGLKGELVAATLRWPPAARPLVTLAGCLRRLIGRRGVDAVHCEAFDAAYIAVVARALAFSRARLIFTVRSERYLNFSALDRFFLKFVDRLATNSEFSRGKIAEGLDVAPERVAVTYSPISFADAKTDEEAPEATDGPSQAKAIAFVGSFEPRKKLDLFIDLGVALRKRGGPAHRFLIFGGPKTAEQERYLRSLQARIAASGVSDAFEFCGYERVGRIARRSDLIVCPYENEPFGRVVAEFLHLGLPVLIRDSGGLAEAGLGFAAQAPGESDAEVLEAFAEAIASGRAFERRGDLAEIRRRLDAAYSVGAVLDRELAMYA
ncbi:MAG: glycosyltransferase family 4 protein [Pseudomonadota bacterium]